MTVHRVDSPATLMTVPEARRSLIESLERANQTDNVREVRFSRDEVRFVADNEIGFATWKGHIDIAGASELTILDFSVGFVVESRGEQIMISPGSFDASFDTYHDARQFADALLVLHQAASRSPHVSDESREAEFQAFVARAKAWALTSPSPPMSDDALTYKVLAEDSIRRKNPTAALDAYCEALQRHPMWPEGHFNAALLAAETEDYELAAHHMRRYLVLAPDARDAAAAKEKFLLWQHKAKE